MFDPRSLKKRLGSLIPSESARASLQNVLTVEWDTHKTVLVDVPGPSKSRVDDDVEMEGMGLNRPGRGGAGGDSGWGKLDDGDDDDLLDYNSNSRSRSRYDTDYSPSGGVPPVPSKPSASQISKAQQKARDNQINPFSDQFSTSDEFIQPQFQSRGSAKPPPPPVRAATMPMPGWRSFGDDSVQTWGRGTSAGDLASPTSSRGTRDSATTSSVEEDPFR